jgi:hypothetical protein
MVQGSLELFFVLGVVAPPAAVIIGLLFVMVRRPRRRRGIGAARVTGPAHI